MRKFRFYLVEVENNQHVTMYGPTATRKFLVAMAESYVRDTEGVSLFIGEMAPNGGIAIEKEPIERS